MQDEAAQRALLEYVLEGNQGESLGRELEKSRPFWMPPSDEKMRRSELIADLNDEEKGRLLSRLYRVVTERIGRGIYEESYYHEYHDDEAEHEQPDPEQELRSILEWWKENCEEKRQEYHSRIWPRALNVESLGACENEEERIHWFTFFALGIFRTLPWGQEAAHKSFVEASMGAGWWKEMALARLPEDFAPWKRQLEAFADTQAWYVTFLQWRRALADLYALARWLPDYAEAFLLLPRVIREHRQIRLSDIWRISMQPIWQKRGLEGAPLAQSLGIGANWMIREAIRQGLWENDEAEVMIPYAWSSTARVRRFFENELGHRLGSRAGMDLSPEMFEFLQSILGNDATFMGDLDLPLQLYTQQGHVWREEGNELLDDADDDAEHEDEWGI